MDFAETRYTNALDGHHERINGKSLEHMSGDERSGLAVHLLLHEVFTPLCIDYACQILNMQRDDIERVIASWQYGIGVGNYDHTKDYEYVPFTAPLPWFENMRNNLLAQISGESGIRPNQFVKISTLQDLEHLDDIMTGKAPANPTKQVIEKILGNGIFQGPEPLTTNLHSQYIANEIGRNGIPVIPHIATGKFSSYYWSPGETSFDAPGPSNHVLVPIGEYGIDFAQKMALATKVLLTLANRLVAEQAIQIKNDNPDLIVCETARGRDNYGDPQSVLYTFQEGIISMKNAFSLLLAEYVNGYDEKQALTSIIDTDLPSRFSRIIPMGITGRLVLTGRYIPHILEGNDNSLQFTDTYEDILHRLHKNHISSRHNYKARMRTLGETKHGCPVGRSFDGQQSGISYLSYAFLHTYQLVDEILQ